MNRRFLTNGGVAALVLGLTATTAWYGGNAAATGNQQPSTARVAVQTAPARDGVERDDSFRASYSQIVDKVSPAVVTVRVAGRARPEQTGAQTPDIEEFRRFFGPQFRMMPQRPERMRGLGSGVIVSQDGYILTNHHVIENADQIRVETSDRRVLEAKLIGQDPQTDLAVLKVQASGLPIVPLGNSDRVRVGDVVLAFGNPLDVGQTVTMGIISAKGRATGAGGATSFEDFLQTDAAINRGNSGGALVNVHGELVGINSQMLTPSGGNVGLGFSIPVNMARSVMDSLVRDGRVQRAKLGVAVQPISAELAKSLGLDNLKGGLVNNVEPDSAAARAGIRQGDVIVEVDGRAIADGNELRNVIAGTKPGTTVNLKVIRDGRPETVKATLAELPSKKGEDLSTSNDDGGSRGRFGMTVQPVTPQLAERFELKDTTSGLVITGVDPDGAAAETGLQPGDVIQKVNGRDVASATELRDSLAKATESKPALLLVSRDGQTRFVTLTPPAA
jgi:Do/DeqQ family serine protease